MLQERLAPVTVERLGLLGAEPVTLAEAKAHLRVVDDEDDALISALISAAREACEDMARRSFALQTWRATFGLDGLPDYKTSGLDKLVLPRPPYSGNAVITYMATSGEEVEFDGIQRTGRDSGGALLDWTPPSDLETAQPSPVSVSYEAGYAVLPSAVRQAVLLMVSNLYENRTPVGEKALSEAPLSVRHLLKPYTVPNA